MPKSSSVVPSAFKDTTGDRDALAGLLTHREAGGINKSVARRAFECLLHPIAARLSALTDAVRRRLIERDPRGAASKYCSMHDVLCELGVPPMGIISARASNRLRRWCVNHGRDSAVRMCPESARYLYRLDAVRDWLELEGRAFIAPHEASIAGKTVARSKRRRRAAPTTKQEAAS